MSGGKRVAVLASGNGSNLKALIQAAAAPAFPASVVLVISNVRGCGALGVARIRGIDAVSLPLSDYADNLVARDRAMVDALRAARTDLVVCAGYNRVLSDEVLNAFPNAILNIHPSLLPAFGGGMHAVADALAAGVKITGCTVHLIAAGAVDAGPIVLQAAVPVEEGDDVDSLSARIHDREWKLLPEAVALWASGRLRVEDGIVHITAQQPSAGAG